MKIALYGKVVNDSVISIVRELSTTKFQLFFHENFARSLKNMGLDSLLSKTFTHTSFISGQFDFVFSIGGDGTLLETLSFVKKSNIPIMGINTGRLGFLSSIGADEVKVAIEAILQNNFTLDKRSLLTLETKEKLFSGLNFCLNEITIHKKDSSSMITIHAYRNGEFLNSYWADGLIISTPTGSTAYSLSCAGPIVMPNSENVIITPIAPHNLNVRPIVISDKDTLTLKVEGRNNNFLVSLDSRSSQIDSDVELKIHKSDFTISLLRLSNQNFLGTLRKKLMWGIDKRN